MSEQRPEPPKFKEGDELEIIDGLHIGARVRVRGYYQMGEIGVPLWRVDWPGVRPLIVREDFMRPVPSESTGEKP